MVLFKKFYPTSINFMFFPLTCGVCFCMYYLLGAHAVFLFPHGEPVPDTY